MEKQQEIKQDHWSDQHLALLKSAAVQLLKHHPASNVTIEDLIAVAWMRCLRKRKPDDLHGCYGYVYRTMSYYVKREAKQLSFELTDVPDKSDVFKFVDTKLDCNLMLSWIDPSLRELLLKKYSGKTYRELEKEYGVTYEAIRLRCCRAINIIRRKCNQLKGTCI